MIRFQDIIQHSKWTLSSALFNLLIQAMLYMMMALYIAPADLGHYFMASALVFIPLGIIEYSFTSSLIHTVEPGRLDYQAVLFINIKVGIVFLLVSGLVAYGLSVYYTSTSIGYYYIGLVPVLLLGLISSIQNAGLKKELRIRQLAGVAIGSSLLYAVVTAVLLVLGYGAGALVAGQVCKAIGMVILLVLTTQYLSLDFKGINAHKEKHQKYGQYIVAEKSFGIGLSYLDTFIVHHYLGAEVLGVYDLLKRFIMRPIMSSYQAIESVVFPILTKVKADLVAFQKTFDHLTWITLPFYGVVVLIFFSDRLLAFLPEVYQSYGQLLNLLIIYAAAHIVVNPIDIMAYALDKTRLFFLWTVGYSVVQVGLMVWGLSYGVETMVGAMVFSLLLFYVLSYFVLMRGRVKLINWLYPVLGFLLLVFVFKLMKVL